MRLLVLDLATHLGYCFGTEAGVIEHGSYKLPSTGENIGQFLFAYRTWLSAAVSRHQPDDITFEMPVLPATGNLHTLRKLYSLAGITELVAQDHCRTVSEANLMNIRNHFIGCRFAPRDIPKPEKRRWLKERTVTECRRRGLRPADDDAADAIALFSYVMTSRVPGFVLAGDEIAVAA